MLTINVANTWFSKPMLLGQKVMIRTPTRAFSTLNPPKVLSTVASSGQWQKASWLRNKQSQMA